MDKDNVVQYKDPAHFDSDPLTELIRDGSRKLIATALELEVQLLLEQYKECRTENGLRAVVRSGYQSPRQIQTGIGSIPVKVPKIRSNTKGQPVSFRSTLIPPYVRKTATLEAVVPLC